MAYYIFLKSLRSLEQFRKNPHVKIPPKSHSTNFQSLGKLKKNPILNSEILFLDFGPTDLAAHPASQPSQHTGCAAPAGQNRPGRPIQHARRSRLRGKYVFPFGSRLPSRPHLPRLSVNRAPDVSSTPTSSRPSSPAPPPIPGHRASLSSAPRVPSSRYHLAFISSPLISLLNLSSSRPIFNGVKAINASVNHPGHPSPALPRLL
jgi:hypothetical protein